MFNGWGLSSSTFLRDAKQGIDRDHRDMRDG